MQLQILLIQVFLTQTFFRYKADPQFSQLPNGDSGPSEAAAPEVEDGPPENEELVRGQVTHVD